MDSYDYLRVIQVTDPQPWRKPIMEALTEIGNRSGGRYSPGTLYGYITGTLMSPQNVFEIGGKKLSGFDMWLCLDNDMMREGADPEQCVCGLSTLGLTPDDCGNPIAFISYGWIKPGYSGDPFDAWLPIAEAWARERKCRALLSMTERSSAAKASERLRFENLQARLRGLIAYYKWIHKRGFVMRETTFWKELS